MSVSPAKLEPCNRQQFEYFSKPLVSQRNAGGPDNNASHNNQTCPSYKLFLKKHLIVECVNVMQFPFLS